MEKHPLHCQLKSRFSRGAVLRYFCFYYLLICSIETCFSAASNISSSNSIDHDHKRDLSNIPGTAACAGCSPENCKANTVEHSACSACATGQIWWPCNLPGECYCTTDTTTTTVDVMNGIERSGTQSGSEACSTAACTSSGGKCVTASPNVSDGQCADCADGKQSWWPCNLVGACVCKLEKTPPPTANPTVKPNSSPAFDTDADADADTDTDTDDSSDDIDTLEPTPTPTPTPTPLPTPKPSILILPPSIAPTDEPEVFTPSTRMLEGMLVLDAHITANKIVLARELLLSPSLNTFNSNAFTFMGFKESLQQMIMTPIMVDGVDPKTMEDITIPKLFYIGDTTTTAAENPNVKESNNERVYGLINVALFLSCSYSDSLSNGSCDEINSDVVDGFLPMSNACGQQGMSYQGSIASSDTTAPRNLQSNPSPLFCNPGDQKYACVVDMQMRAQARSPEHIPTRNNVDDGDSSSPGPFYCGPKADYNGFTGHWDFEQNKEIFQSAKQNRLGRTDVEGCCFWGRGSIQIRGTCAYGKLNYYLGKRAADEGRPAMFPDVDFCQDPGAICDDKYPNLKWIAGLFRWITEVQEYDIGGFNYINQLRQFVDDGFTNMKFVDSVSGIVSQGCHKPPCIEGATFRREERRTRFIKVMKMLGFSVPQNNEESM